MGAYVEDKLSASVRCSQTQLVDHRPGRVVKRTKERKHPKAFSNDTTIDAAEYTSPEPNVMTDVNEKKSQAIVIDGRTYTCATCKTGHRVGICKHARDRPMTATHPPGRPPAGAPKKVVCDCPKQCNCKKRDCKCARKCNCTQVMYMLVYIPASGEDESANEEKGSWKLGKQVMTDLKGNLLTEEQVKERQEQKEAQKTQSPEKRISHSITANTVEPWTTSSPKQESKPTTDSDCCKHKDKVSTQQVVTNTPSHPDNMSKAAAEGCNCGQACACAFCPQHPNNSTSMNMALQQAVHFASQPYTDNHQTIIPFPAAIPQGASCMGGRPQFAVSPYPQRPSNADMRDMFRQPGFVIGYPIWKTDVQGYSTVPFPNARPPMPDMSIMNNSSLHSLQPQVQTTLNQIPLTSMQTPINSTQDDFTIDNDYSYGFDVGHASFITSAGPDGWDHDLLSPSIWPPEGPVLTSATGNFMDTSGFLDPSATHPELPITTMPNNIDFEFFNNVNHTTISAPSGFTEATPLEPSSAMLPPVAPRRSCCSTVKSSESGLDDSDDVKSLTSPTSGVWSPLIMKTPFG